MKYSLRSFKPHNIKSIFVVIMTWEHCDNGLDYIIRYVDRGRSHGNFFTFCTSGSLRIKLRLFHSQAMAYQDIKPYVTHLSTFQVVVCRFCEICIPPKDPFEHYKRHHTAKRDYYVPMEIRHKIAEYMATLDLCQPQEVRTSDDLVPELKIVKEGFKCNFPGCDACVISEQSMRTHYYSHQKHIPKDFKNWESTSIQTFFEGYHKKYEKSFIC
jgi:hypothetical protein